VNGVQVESGRTTRFVAELLNGLPPSWVVLGQPDGTIAVQPKPKRESAADDVETE
jgi:hypothetical protein